MDFNQAIFSDTVSLFEEFKWKHETNIYHYTSPQGLIGILKADTDKKVKLWFSKSDHLNDVTEGTHIVTVFNEVLDKLKSEQKIDNDYYQLLRIEDFRPRLLFWDFSDEKIKGGNKEYDTYLCCFSKDQDSLPMWNYYSKNNRYEGFNIGFSFFNCEEKIKREITNKGCKLHFLEVIYDDNFKKEYIERKLIEYYFFYIDDKIRKDSIKKMIHTWLYSAMSVFKNKCFSHEKEVRAVLLVPRDTSGKKPFPIQFRAHEEMIIPYIEMSFPKACVEEITIAPTNKETDTVQNGLKMFLDQNGINDIPINISKVPIRY